MEEALLDTALVVFLALDVSLQWMEETLLEAGRCPLRPYHRSWGNSLDLDTNPGHPFPSASTRILSHR